MYTRSRSSLAPKYEDFQPITETKESPESHLLLIHLPGFKRDQVRVIYESSNRRIRAFGERPHGVDNRFSRFNHPYPLPESCDTKRLRQRFEGETLTIIMPKKVISRVSPKEELKPTQQAAATPAKPTIDQPKPEKAPEVIPPKSTPKVEEPKATAEVQKGQESTSQAPETTIDKQKPRSTIDQPKPEKTQEIIPPKSTPKVEESKATAEVQKGRESTSQAPETTIDKQKPRSTIDQPKPEKTQEIIPPKSTPKVEESKATVEVQKKDQESASQEPKTAIDKQKQVDEKKMDTIIPKKDTSDSTPQKEVIAGKATVTTETKDQADDQKRAGRIAENVERQRVEKKEMKENSEKASESRKPPEKSSVGGSSDQKESKESSMVAESSALKAKEEEKEKKEKINGKVSVVSGEKGKEDAIDPKGKGIQEVITRMTKKLSDEDKQMLIYVGAGAAIIVAAALAVYSSYKFRSLPR